MDLEPDWNDYRESVLNDMPQQAAAKKNLEPELSGYGEDILDDITRQLANPYNHRPAQGSSRDPVPHIRTRRDLNNYLLQRSAMLRDSEVLLSEQVTFNQDNMATVKEMFAEAASSFESDLLEGDKGSLNAETAESLVTFLTSYINNLNTPHRSRLHDAVSKVASFAGALGPYFKIVELIISSHPEFSAIAWSGIRLVFQLSSQYVEYFEKLAEMFEQLSEKLPRYSRQFDLIRDRRKRHQDDNAVGYWKWEDSKWDSYYISLAKSLAFVYQDVLSFCQDACSILPRRSLGNHERMKRFFSRVWIPIDQRFSKILGRLKLHQQLFEEGLQEAFSTEMIIAFNDLDRERKANISLHEKIEICIGKSDVAGAQQNEIQQAFMDSQRAIRAAEEAKKIAIREANVKKAMTEKVQALRAWIAAPDWTALFYAAEKHRAGNTGDWFIRQHKYRSWLEDRIEPESRNVEFSKRLLFISGKPGYGKTVLSTRIISDIRQRVERNKRTDKAAIAFFYFNAQHSDATSSGSALRAILTQLLHDNKDNTDFIDLAALMMDDMGSGQSRATDREVQSIIQVFLGRLGVSFLIFDGFDECEDWEELLEALKNLTQESDCSIVCTGRPHLSVVSMVGANTSQIRLESQGNLADIKRYLEPKIHALQKRGKLPNSLTVAEMVDTIANRADSMFLWVVLMISYLSSPLLTPNNRLQAINNIHLLEGLDAMFMQILEDLQRRLPKSEWSKIKRVFQWLVVAQTPWTIKMLHTALAVQNTRPITPDDYISDFHEALIQTVGSFVEIYSDGTVRFIHLSVQEFLADPSPEFQSSELSRSFYVQKEHAHCSMATLCLYYMMYNIPHKPITATAQQGVGASDLSKQYPLLAYATKWWPTHACQSLRLNDRGASGYSADCYRTLFKAVAETLWNKEFLSCWIETSYIFHNVPSLDTMKSCVGALQKKYPEVWKFQIESIVDTLNRLAPELNRLNTDWGHILKKEPNEIWLPSITALGRFDLWASSGNAKTSFLESEDDEGSILIASQVSADGARVGMLKIWTSVSKDIKDDASASSEYWEVAYQIWSLETMSQIECIRFEIPQEKLLDLNIQDKSAESKQDNNLELVRFRFPVAFSSTLSLLVVYGILLKINPAPMLKTRNDRGYFQILPRPGCEHTLDMDALAFSQPMHTGEKRFSFQRGFKIVPADHKCHSWAQYLLSPNEKYLIQINGSGPPSEASTRRWIASAYKDSSIDNWMPSFYLVASVGIQFRVSSTKNNTVDRFLSFHPFLPVVAICRLATISLWFFMEKGKGLIQIYNSLLDNICWSVCGNSLHGTDPTTKQMVLVDLTEHMPPPVKALEAPISPTSTTSSTAGAASIVNQNSESKEVSMNGQIISSEISMSMAVQSTGTPVFSISESGVSFSSLNQNVDNSSAIILQNAGPGGEAAHANLMRLPKSSTLEKSYSTLVNTGDNEKLRLVLNMAAQETYSTQEKADFSLPAIFDRDTESIVSVKADHWIREENLKIVKSLPEMSKMPVEKKAIEAPIEQIGCGRGRSMTLGLP